jgi:hypothetical protein
VNLVSGFLHALPGNTLLLKVGPPGSKSSVLTRMGEFYRTDLTPRYRRTGHWHSIGIPTTVAESLPKKKK